MSENDSTPLAARDDVGRLATACLVGTGLAAAGASALFAYVSSLAPEGGAPRPMYGALLASTWAAFVVALLARRALKAAAGGGATQGVGAAAAKSAAWSVAQVVACLALLAATLCAGFLGWAILNYGSGR